MLLALLLVSSAPSQLSESQVIQLAIGLVKRLSPDAQLHDHRAWQSVDSTRPVPNVHYSFFSGQIQVNLDSIGALEGYSDLSDWANEPHSGPEKFKTDEEAWRALDSLLLKLDVPEALTERTLSRTGAPYAYVFSLRPRPFGYGSQGGDSADCQLQRVTGRLIMLGIRRGWTYEPPKVKVTKEEAIEKAFETFGVKEQAWKCELKYWAVGNESAPVELRDMYARKTLRLHYVLSRRYEYQSLLVDSVTGKVVDSGRYALVMETMLGKPTSVGKTVYADSEGNFSGAGASTVKPATNRWLSVGAGIVTLVVIAIFFVLAKRLRRKAS